MIAEPSVSKASTISRCSENKPNKALSHSSKAPSQISQTPSRLSKALASELSSVALRSSYNAPNQMTALHKAYGNMKENNFSKKAINNFKKTIEDSGFRPGSKFDKVISDPSPKFNCILKELEDFKPPTQKNWMKDNHEPSHPRYKRKGPVLVGEPQNERMKVINAYEKGRINENQLKEIVGEKDYSKLDRKVVNSQDGHYTGLAAEYLIDHATTNMMNQTPVKNDEVVFSQNFARGYEKDSNPMSVQRVDQRAIEEAFRKTDKLYYSEKRNEGPAYAVSRENNGDVVKWTHGGNVIAPSGERYAHAKKVNNRERHMQGETLWSADMAQPKRGPRRDTYGNGNIINWMS